MPTFDPTQDEEETELLPVDTDLYDPTSGTPWCHFRARSLICTNGAHCKNKNHRGEP